MQAVATSAMRDVAGGAYYVKCQYCGYNKKVSWFDATFRKYVIQGNLRNDHYRTNRWNKKAH